MSWAVSHLRTCRPPHPPAKVVASKSGYEWCGVFKILRFLFLSYGHFSVIFLKKSPQFSMITRKKKIGEFFNYFTRSIQNTVHHSQSFFEVITAIFDEISQ